MKGTVVVAGITLDVIDVMLVRGRFEVVARCAGPTPETDGWATVFGSDGQGIYQHPKEMHLPATTRRGWLTVYLPLVISEAVPAGTL